MSPLPFVNVIVLLDTEAVSKEEAVIELCTNPNSVIWAEPETVPDGRGSPEPVSTVNENVVLSPLVNVIILLDTEAVSTLSKDLEAVSAKFAWDDDISFIISWDDETAYEALTANDENELEIAFKTYEAVWADNTDIEDVWEFVIKDAVAELVTNPNSEIWIELDITPEGKLEPVSTVMVKLVPSPLVNVKTLPETEPVVSKDPVFVLPPPPEPVATVTSKVDKSPKVKVNTFSLAEAVIKAVALLADAAKGKVNETPFALVNTISPTPPEAVVIASGITLPNAFTDTLSKNLVFCAIEHPLLLLINTLIKIKYYYLLNLFLYFLHQYLFEFSHHLLFVDLLQIY